MKFILKFFFRPHKQFPSNSIENWEEFSPIFFLSSHSVLNEMWKMICWRNFSHSFSSIFQVFPNACVWVLLFASFRKFNQILVNYFAGQRDGGGKKRMKNRTQFNSKNSSIFTLYNSWPANSRERDLLNFRVKLKSN